MIDLQRIHPGMEVLSAEGERLGLVRRLMGQMLFLEESAKEAGEDPSVPLAWILSVDEAAHLAKTRPQVEAEWRADGGSRL